MSEFSLNNQVSIKNPHSRVSKWWGPYNSITEAKTATAAVRNIGFPVGIMQDGYVVEHIWQKVDDGFDFISEGTATEQFVDTGGNFTDLEVTADAVVFENENAQAILSGIVSSKNVITLINRSTTFQLAVFSEGSSVPAGARKIKLREGQAQTSIQGVTTLRYSASLGMYEIASEIGMPYAPEYVGKFTEIVAQCVNPDGETEGMPFEEIEVYRNAQSTLMTKAELNTAYENAQQGFQAVCPLIGIIYKKMDNFSTGVWQPIHYGETEWQQITLDATYVVSGNLYVKRVAGRILLSSNGLLEFTGSVNTTTGSIIGTIPTGLRFDTTKQIALKCVNGNNIICFITLAGEIKVYRAGQVYVQEELTQFTGTPS